MAADEVWAAGSGPQMPGPPCGWRAAGFWKGKGSQCEAGPHLSPGRRQSRFTDEESDTQVKADLLQSELHSREARAADSAASLRFRWPSLDPRSS